MTDRIGKPISQRQLRVGEMIKQSLSMIFLKNEAKVPNLDVIGGDLDGNDGLIGAPLLNVEVVLGLKPPGLTDPPRLGNLFDCFSITTEFFP